MQLKQKKTEHNKIMCIFDEICCRWCLNTLYALFSTKPKSKPVSYNLLHQLHLFTYYSVARYVAWIHWTPMCHWMHINKAGTMVRNTYHLIINHVYILQCNDICGRNTYHLIINHVNILQCCDICGRNTYHSIINHVYIPQCSKIYVAGIHWIPKPHQWCTNKEVTIQ